MNATKYEETKNYKSNQKFYSQLAMVSLSVLNTSFTNTSPPTRTSSTVKERSASESNLEPTMKELKGMTKSIADYIYDSGELPEGTRKALAMSSALLTSRRECAATRRVKPEQDLNRSSSDAGHERAIFNFAMIHRTLQDAVAFLSRMPSPTAPLPVPRRANKQNFNMYEVLGDPQSPSLA